VGNVFGGFCVDMVVTSTLSDTISAFFDCCAVNDECGICLDTITAVALTLPCSHKFCASCLDGWKSKFGASLYDNDNINKKERSKSCPLCRKKIPQSKDMLIQLEHHRKEKRRLEDKGDTTSGMYLNHLELINRLEAEIGTYEGKGLDYDGCIEIPKYIFNAVKNNDIKSVMDWLGSPVDKKRLNARYPDYLNATLIHLAVADHAANSDLLSILLQYGADVNALDANGCSCLIHAAKHSFEQAKILLEWGAEISMPREFVQTVKQCRLGISDRELFILAMDKSGNDKLANLISSEFGGRRCEVMNLPNHPQLNGKTCVVEKYITKKDRYKIIFEGSGNAALVGPNNLKRHDRTPLDCGYYISFKNGRMSCREFATREECQAYVTSIGSSNGEDVEETTEELASLKL